MDFSFFDAVYCINLYTRNDRYMASKQIFTKYNIPVEYYRTYKHPNGGLQGCFESHINVINKAWNRGAKNVLIFEDDLMVISKTKDLVRNLNRAVNFMREKQWDIFYLGAVPDYRRKSCHRVADYPGVYNLGGICTHAYVINRRAMNILRKIQYNGTPYDFYLRDNFKCFAIYPSLFYQGGFSSDITTNKNKDIHEHANPGLVNLWFRFSETYAYYIGLSLPRLLLFILVLIISYKFRCKIPLDLLLSILFVIMLNIKE
jgi:glycosyl transferase, family 25